MSAHSLVKRRQSFPKVIIMIIWQICKLGLIQKLYA